MGIVLILLGVSITAFGYRQFRVPWARYQSLKASEANIARYEGWRGGLRDAGPTGASVAIAMHRDQARKAGVMMAAGIAVFILGVLLS